MLTPQQIQEISFERALFGGYDMSSVDEILEPLTEDYLTLYKENSVLKSKMRILVEKLEEYRHQEGSMQSALLAAQKTCDQMIAEAEKKCARLLHDAQETAAARAENTDALLGTERERLEAAQNATSQFIDSMERRLKRQLELLEELRSAELLPRHGEPARGENRAFDFDKAPSAPTPEEKADALIEEIGMQIEAAVGETAQSAPSHPVQEAAPEARHGELSPGKQKLFNELQFGRK